MMRKLKLKSRYDQLRAAGFTNAEATRLKFHSDSLVEYMIQQASTILVDYRKERANKLEEALCHAPRSKSR